MTCLPGFVVNSGGVFASTLFDLGVHPARIEAMCRQQYRPVVGALLERARREGRPAVAVAEDVARLRLHRRGAAGGEPTLARIARRVARRSFVLRSMYGRYRFGHYAHDLVELEREIAGGTPCTA